MTLAQKKRFGFSSEKYADGYEQMNLFNKAETMAQPEQPEPEYIEVHPVSHKRKDCLTGFIFFRVQMIT